MKQYDVPRAGTDTASLESAAIAVEFFIGTEAPMATIARSGRRLCAELLEDRRQLSAVTVTTHLDVVDAVDGLISLREAIQTTNSSSGADEIYCYA